MTKVINMFAGPGAGKSTTKAGLFFEMKLAGYKVEIVEEFAKELTYDGAFETMENEMYMLAEQDRRLRRLVGKVDYIISDAPLLKSLFYVRGVYDTAAYKAHIRHLFDGYDNLNVWINRTKPYQTYGRTQTEAEAFQIHSQMYAVVEPLMHLFVDGDRAAPRCIINYLEGRE